MIYWNDASHSDKHLLESIKILNNHDDYLLQQFFHSNIPRLKASPKALVSNLSTSSSEITQRKASMDIWNGSGNLPLHEMLSTWNHDNWLRFFKAIIYMKDLAFRIEECPF